MAGYGFGYLDQMDEQGNLLPGGGMGGGTDVAGLLGKYGIPGLSAGLQGAGLLASIVGRSKQRKRLKQQAENQALEADNQASEAKGGIALDTRDAQAKAEAENAGRGFYATSAMDALRRSIRDRGQAQTAAVDAQTSRVKNDARNQLTEALRPGYSAEIAGGAQGLVRSLGALFPRPALDTPPDPMGQPGGDPSLTSESFANQGDRGGGGAAAYAGADDPERIYRARLAFLRGGRRGETGGDGGMV